jgi:hypothetical protein
MTKGQPVPWLIRDVVNDINKAAGKRWHALDPLLPEPGDLPEGCMAPLVATGANGRPAWPCAFTGTSRPAHCSRPGAR